jgi:hypothetical protein
MTITVSVDQTWLPSTQGGRRAGCACDTARREGMGPGRSQDIGQSGNVSDLSAVHVQPGQLFKDRFVGREMCCREHRFPDVQACVWGEVGIFKVQHDTASDRFAQNLCPICCQE